ncbi:MAG: oligosaccharide flippase family protein, partial [Thaumarchaeota archaeon]|nr:oligosaccharide flippase family protein [Nitrososphaerota archaeon]
LVGLNRTAKAGIYYTLSFMVRYFLAIGLVVLGIGVTGVLTAWIVSDVLMVIICAINLGSIARGPTERLSHTEVLRYSVPVVVSSVVVFGVTQIDKLFALGRFTLSELGIYNVAVAASLIAAFAPNAISLALLPRLSALFTQDSRQTFLILARKYTRYVSLIAIPMSFQIAALSKPLTQLFGAQYIQAATSAAIISAVMGVTVISSIHNASLLASQNAGRVMRANILGLTTFAIFMLTLSPFLGFEVLAWSRATMIIVITLVIELYAYKRGFLVIDWRAYISSLTAATVMGIILMLIVNTVGGYLRLIALLPVLIFLGILIYFSILRLIKTFNNDDMDFVKSLLPQRLGFLVNWAAKVMGVKLTQTEKD